MTKKE